MISFPLRTAPGQNVREHFRVRAKRVEIEKQATAWALLGTGGHRPPVPCSVRLTRIAPSGGLDDDNLSGSLKAVRDAVAQWIGVDDKHTEQVRYVYAQRRGPWGVEIEFGHPVNAVEFVSLEAAS